MEEKALTELFSALGAPDPRRWARSQLQEGIPQLARFLFLREAWKLVVDENDDQWIHEHRSAEAALPGGTISAALDGLLKSGISTRDLTKIVRVMQWKLLFGLCYLLDDPGGLEDAAKGVAWGLFQVNDANVPVARMSGLHESVLETDPTGREMKS